MAVRGTNPDQWQQRHTAKSESASDVYRVVQCAWKPAVHAGCQSNLRPKASSPRKHADRAMQATDEDMG